MNRIFINGHYILYIGTSFETVKHRHHAAQICIGLDSTFELTNQQGVVGTYHAVLIKANSTHQLNAPNTAIASLFLDVHSCTYITLTKRYQLTDRNVFQSIGLSTEVFILLARLRRQFTHTVAKTAINKINRELVGQVPSSPSIDPRINKVLQQLNQACDQQIPLEKLAKSVHLSPSRLCHLFKSEIGTPIRRYSLWNRIRVAIEYAVMHQSLTDGALQAGFTDSSHFSRIFKEMYGFNPSAIMNSQTPMIVITS